MKKENPVLIDLANAMDRCVRLDKANADLLEALQDALSLIVNGESGIDDTRANIEARVRAAIARATGVDPDPTTLSTCEHCGAPAEYDSELILCPRCNE